MCALFVFLWIPGRQSTLRIRLMRLITLLKNRDKKPSKQPFTDVRLLQSCWKELFRSLWRPACVIVTLAHSHVPNRQFGYYCVSGVCPLSEWMGITLAINSGIVIHFISVFPFQASSEFPLGHTGNLSFIFQRGSSLFLLLLLMSCLHSQWNICYIDRRSTNTTV